jgi:hypothetical protein
MSCRNVRPSPERSPQLVELSLAGLAELKWVKNWKMVKAAVPLEGETSLCHSLALSLPKEKN